MRKRMMLSALLLLFAMLFSACSGQKNAEVINALRESDELWIAHGLEAWEEGKEREDLSYLFYDAESTRYLTLYNHMFTYDEEISTKVAEQFFLFMADRYSLEAILNTERRMDFKNQYLQSLGLQFKYSMNEEADKFFSEMDFQSDSSYKYIMSNDKFSFSFPDFQVNPDEYVETIRDYWNYIFEISKFIDAFAELVEWQELGEYFDTGRYVDFRCDRMWQPGASAVADDGTADLRSFYDACREAVKVYANFSAEDGANRMLGEGLARYFSDAYGINYIHRTYECFYLLRDAASGALDSAATGGDEDAKRAVAILRLYEIAGGGYEYASLVDEKLFIHLNALVDRDYGKPVTLYDAETSVTGAKIEPYAGSELTYAECASFVTWLVDFYKLKPVLEAWKTNDFTASLGKSYSELKAEWKEFIEPYRISSEN